MAAAAAAAADGSAAALVGLLDGTVAAPDATANELTAEERARPAVADYWMAAAASERASAAITTCGQLLTWGRGADGP